MADFEQKLTALEAVVEKLERDSAPRADQLKERRTA